MLAWALVKTRWRIRVVVRGEMKTGERRNLCMEIPKKSCDTGVTLSNQVPSPVHHSRKREREKSKALPRMHVMLRKFSAGSNHFGNTRESPQA